MRLQGEGILYNKTMRERYSKITKDILLGLAVTGAVLIAATSPYFSLNLIRAIKKDKKYIKKYFEKRKVERAFARLRKNRLVILQEKDGKFIVKLTEKGKRKVKEIQYEKLKIEKPDVWDGKWRIVTFDIPNKKNAAREALRRKIKELGFYFLQKSVWVYPYPCEKEIQFLVELFEVWPYVDIIVAKEISNDVKLKKHFRLL